MRTRSHCTSSHQDGRWRTDTSKASMASSRGVPQRTLVPYSGRCAGDHRKLTDPIQPGAPAQRFGLPDAGRIRKWLCKCGKQKTLHTFTQPRRRLRTEIQVLIRTGLNRFISALKCSVLVLTRFSYSLAYHAGMFSTQSGRKTFVFTCKRCRRNVPSGVREFPFQSIAVECPSAGNSGEPFHLRSSSVGLTNSWFSSRRSEADEASVLPNGDTKIYFGLSKRFFRTAKVQTLKFFRRCELTTSIHEFYRNHFLSLCTVPHPDKPP
jgi:hypothetical protein